MPDSSALGPAAPAAAPGVRSGRTDVVRRVSVALKFFQIFHGRNTKARTRTIPGARGVRAIDRLIGWCFHLLIAAARASRNSLTDVATEIKE